MNIWRGQKKIFIPPPPPPQIFLKVMELCSKTLPVINKIKIYIYTVPTSRKLRLSRLVYVSRRSEKLGFQRKKNTNKQTDCPDTTGETSF